jgi:hypothetical protein
MVDDGDTPTRCWCCDFGIGPKSRLIAELSDRERRTDAAEFAVVGARQPPRLTRTTVEDTKGY